MTKFIVIKTTFAASHNWPECDIPAVGFLNNQHRHLFYVKIKWEVISNNREMEFLTKKDDVDRFIDKNWKGKFLGGLSCEDLAECLLKKFSADMVSVFEDNENGAEIYKECE